MRSGRADDRGVVAAVAGVMMTALLVVLAFGFNGGQILRTFVRADDLASGAARAAAQGVDTSTLASDGTVTLDPTDARARAVAFLARADEDGSGTVGVSGGEATVTVTLSYDLWLVPGSRDVSATATASATSGVTGPATQAGSR